MARVGAAGSGDVVVEVDQAKGRFEGPLHGGLAGAAGVQQGSVDVEQADVTHGGLESHRWGRTLPGSERRATGAPAGANQPAAAGLQLFRLQIIAFVATTGLAELSGPA